MIQQQMEEIQQNKPLFTFWGGGPGKWDVITGGKGSYELFCKVNSTTKITFKEYKDSIIALNNYYIDHMLTTGNCIILPQGLGEMCINKYKKGTKLLTSKDGTQKFYSYSVNWAESNKQQKIVYFLNEDTGGYNFNWKWFKTSRIYMQLLHPSVWRMKMTINAKVKLSKFVRNPENEDVLFFRETNTAAINKRVLKKESKEKWVEESLQNRKLLKDLKAKRKEKEENEI